MRVRGGNPRSLFKEISHTRAAASRAKSQRCALRNNFIPNILNKKSLFYLVSAAHDTFHSRHFPISSYLNFNTNARGISSRSEKSRARKTQPVGARGALCASCVNPVVFLWDTDVFGRQTVIPDPRRPSQISRHRPHLPPSIKNWNFAPRISTDAEETQRRPARGLTRSCVESPRSRRLDLTRAPGHMSKRNVHRKADALWQGFLKWCYFLS